MLIWARSGKQSHGGDQNLPASGISTFSFQLGFTGWTQLTEKSWLKNEIEWTNEKARNAISEVANLIQYSRPINHPHSLRSCPRLFSWANYQLNSSIYRPGSNVAFYIQQFRERLSEKMSTRKSRKVIWDMIKTLFLTLKLSNFALILTKIRPQASRAIL